MRGYEAKRKITKAFMFLSIPYTIILPYIIMWLLMRINSEKPYALTAISYYFMTGKEPIEHGLAETLAGAPFLQVVIEGALLAFACVGLLSVIVTTITSGMYGRVLIKAAKAFRGTFLFCPPVVTVLFFFILICIAIYVFAAVAVFPLLVPSVSIFISYRKRFRKVLKSNYGFADSNRVAA